MRVNQLKKNHIGNLEVYWDRSLEDQFLKMNFTFNDIEAINNISSFIEKSQTWCCFARTGYYNGIT